jgi:predicted nucleotidyltransferase
VRVFGSVVRGQARPDSDIDFLVVFDAGRSLFDLGALEAELRDLLEREVHVVDLPPVAEMAPYERDVADRIRREAVVL